VRSPFKSIRARLTLWYSFIVLTTLALFGVIAYTYSSRQLVDNLDRLLTSDAQWVSSYLTPKAGRVKPSRKFTTKQKQPIEPESIFPGEDLAAQPQDADDAFWSELYIHSLVNRRNTLIEVTDKRGNLIFRSVNSPDENLAIGEVPVNTIKIITLRTEDGAQLRVAATSTDKQNIYVAYPRNSTPSWIISIRSFLFSFRSRSPSPSAADGSSRTNRCGLSISSPPPQGKSPPKISIRQFPATRQMTSSGGSS